MAPKKKKPAKKAKSSKKRSAPKDKDLITANEELFCEFLVNPLNHNNRTEAYLYAYPHSRKWKRNSIYSKACHLYKKDKIQARIDELRKELQEEGIASIHEILTGLTSEIRFDPRKLVDPETGEPLPLHKLDKETALALREFEVFEITTISEKGNETTKIKTKYKYPEKAKSREILGKWHGIFEKDNNQKAGLVIQMSEKDKEELVAPKTEERVNDILAIHKILLRIDMAKEDKD